MTVENYTAFASSVEAEVMKMDIEQQLNILSIVISAMNRKKKNEPENVSRRVFGSF